MEGAGAAANYSIRHVSNSGSGLVPGVDVTVPVPTDEDIISWRVKIRFDMQTANKNIQVSSRSTGINMERLDFSGYQFEFKPRNGSLNLDEPIRLNVDFTFLDPTIRADLKRWHYPCISSMECELIREKTTDYMALAIVIGCSVGIVFLVGLCCASFVWCMKNDGSYGSSSRLVSAYSIRLHHFPNISSILMLLLRTVYDKSELKKVRPYSADSE